MKKIGVTLAAALLLAGIPDTADAKLVNYCTVKPGAVGKNDVAQGEMYARSRFRCAEERDWYWLLINFEASQSPDGPFERVGNWRAKTCKDTELCRLPSHQPCYTGWVRTRTDGRVRDGNRQKTWYSAVFSRPTHIMCG